MSDVNLKFHRRDLQNPQIFFNHETLIVFSVNSVACYELNSFTNPTCRDQEEESLRAAIALSKQDTVEGDEGEGEEGPPTTNGEPDLLLDFGSTGE